VTAFRLAPTWSRVPTLRVNDFELPRGARRLPGAPRAGVPGEEPGGARRIRKIPESLPQRLEQALLVAPLDSNVDIRRA